MLTTKSNQAAKLRLVSQYGDLAMFLQFMHSNIWRAFYTGEKKPYWKIFTWIIFAKIEMFALASRSLFRINHGENSTGVLMSIWTYTLIVTFNAEHVIGFLVSFIPFIAPLLPIFFSFEEFTNYTFIDIHSMPLMVWLILFTGVQSGHLIRIYYFKKTPDDKGSRGSSLILFLLPKKLKISEFSVQCFIEPGMIILFGIAGLVFLEDKVFFVFALISGLCLSFQELLDGAFRTYHSRH